MDSMVRYEQPKIETALSYCSVVVSVSRILYKWYLLIYIEVIIFESSSVMPHWNPTPESNRPARGVCALSPGIIVGRVDRQSALEAATLDGRAR